MGLFNRRPTNEPASLPTWVPTFDLATARPVVFALAATPASDDAQVRRAIYDLGRMSERPELERAIHMIRTEPEVLARPWSWLLAVMEAAAEAGDHHLAAAGLFWSWYWTTVLVPRNQLGDFPELGLDPIPSGLKASLITVGAASAGALPPEFAVVGDASGIVVAGPLSELSPGAF